MLGRSERNHEPRLPAGAVLQQPLRDAFPDKSNLEEDGHVHTQVHKERVFYWDSRETPEWSELFM